MENIIYGVDQSEDYEGGGVIAVFSTYEKAKEYAGKIKLGACSSVEIIEMEIDNPLYKGKEYDYKHG